MIGAVVAVIAADILTVSTVVTYVAMLESVMWIDSLKGWDKILGTSQVSRLLQRWITTREPSAQELRTAQLALRELVAAHSTLS